MAIDAYGNTLTTSTAATTSSGTTTVTNPNGVLGKDDFLKLLMLELKNQDPTSPMDSEKILSQTSQLATLEASTNTTTALTTLASSLSTSAQFTGISAIGKIADTGSNAITLTQGSSTSFQLYLPSAATSGNVQIMDVNGKVLKTMPIGATNAGVAQYSWDGTDDTGATLKAGTYYAGLSYTKTDGTAGTTRVGLYPIQSIKFDSGKTYANLAGNYVDFSTIKEISGG
jgi:flagellar basal-body rod modification protein FlgD